MTNEPIIFTVAILMDEEGDQGYGRRGRKGRPTQRDVTHALTGLFNTYPIKGVAVTENNDGDAPDFGKFLN